VFDSAGQARQTILRLAVAGFVVGFGQVHQKALHPADSVAYFDQTPRFVVVVDSACFVRITLQFAEAGFAVWFDPSCRRVHQSAAVESVDCFVQAPQIDRHRIAEGLFPGWIQTILRPAAYSDLDLTRT
jgi:hypothetical protein